MREAYLTNSMTRRRLRPLPHAAAAGDEGPGGLHPAADGQMGSVMQVYREWLLSGDDGLAPTHLAPRQAALEFAWKYWDADRDGVMEGVQHNTYDIEFYGANTMMGEPLPRRSQAGEEMARNAWW